MFRLRAGHREIITGAYPLDNIDDSSSFSLTGYGGAFCLAKLCAIKLTVFITGQLVVHFASDCLAVRVAPPRLASVLATRWFLRLKCNSRLTIWSDVFYGSSFVDGSCCSSPSSVPECSGMSIRTLTSVAN